MRKYWWVVACVVVLVTWGAFQLIDVRPVKPAITIREARQAALLEFGQGVSEVLAPFALVGLFVGLYKWYREPDARAKQTAA